MVKTALFLKVYDTKRAFSLFFYLAYFCYCHVLFFYKGLCLGAAGAALGHNPVWVGRNDY